MSLALATELEHPVYDCMYLALAEIDRATVVTADKHLARKVSGTRSERRLRLLGTPGQ